MRVITFATILFVCVIAVAADTHAHSSEVAEIGSDKELSMNTADSDSGDSKNPCTETPNALKSSAARDRCKVKCEKDCKRARRPRQRNCKQRCNDCCVLKHWEEETEDTLLSLLSSSTSVSSSTSDESSAGWNTC